MNLATTLITGATGFIGSRLAMGLAGQGESVSAFCRRNSDTAPLAHKNIRIVYGDVRDAAAVKRALQGCDRVFHMAGYARNWARDALVFRETNVGGLRNVLEAARQSPARKIVFTSSNTRLRNSKPRNWRGTMPGADLPLPS